MLQNLFPESLLNNIFHQFNFAAVSAHSSLQCQQIFKPKVCLTFNEHDFFSQKSITAIEKLSEDHKVLKREMLNKYLKFITEAKDLSWSS